MTHHLCVEESILDQDNAVACVVLYFGECVPVLQCDHFGERTRMLSTKGRHPSLRVDVWPQIERPHGASIRSLCRPLDRK
jgi:hypothetical protein